jgi:hypothetical protein
MTRRRTTTMGVTMATTKTLKVVVRSRWMGTAEKEPTD